MSSTDAANSARFIQPVETQQNAEALSALALPPTDEPLAPDGNIRHTLGRKLAYGAGDVYGGGAFMLFSLLFMNYLVLVEGLPIFATTIIIFIGRLWDAVTDPIIGRISDRTRSRFGRRRIFFLVGIIPVFLSFVMLFNSFGITSTTGKIIYYILAYMFFGTAFSIVMVPYNAVLSDMTGDYDQRTSYTTIRMLLSGAASLLAAIVPLSIIRAFGANDIGPEQSPGYLAMALVFGAIFALCWVVVFFGTWERRDLPPVAKVTWRDWVGILHNKPYRNFLGIFLAFQIGVDTVLALFIFYIDIVLLQFENYQFIVGALLVTMIALMPVMGWLAQRRGKAFPLYIGLPVWIVTMLVFLFIDSTIPVGVLMGMGALIAVGAAAGNLATWSMLTDIYDIDELTSGTRREGLYSGATTFLRKAASGMSVLLIGAGFYLIGFDQTEYNLLKETLGDYFDPAEFAANNIVVGIRFMFVLLPTLLLITCLVFTLRNQITKRRFDAVMHGISAMKSDGNLESLAPQEVSDIQTVTGVDRSELEQVVFTDVN